MNGRPVYLSLRILQGDRDQIPAHREKQRGLNGLILQRSQQRRSCRSNIINTRSLDTGSRGLRGCLSVGLITASGLILLQIERPGSLGSREHTAGIHFVPGWIDTRELGISIFGTSHGGKWYIKRGRFLPVQLLGAEEICTEYSEYSDYEQMSECYYICYCGFLRWIPRNTQVYFVSSLLLNIYLHARIGDF